ncbi:pyridoxal phosphate-dependent aminotransferase [Konateibacter massiliensis]|uniref:pyridoxal phosphate-dependent aminotransferase n=1 Tax=Konateibacter massiliensis TaxID=2002841 RepID=UPI001F2D1C3C|nr:threonine-phosphate decarboxylase [Konateibacter massiliensis]
MENVHGGDIYQYENVTDFSANINPLGLPRGVKMALMDSIDKTVHYPDIHCRKLRKKLALEYGVKEEYILFGNGAADIIFTVTTALKPRKSLILAPTFVEYKQALLAVGSKVVSYELKKEYGFQVREDFLNYISADLDMLFLCNPNNPTGEVIPKPFLMRIIEKCHRNNVLLVIDECFNSFLDDGEMQSAIKEVAQYGNLIIVNAFTKLYAMPGVRLGFGIVSNKRIHEFITRCSQPWNVSILAQEAGLAALEERGYVQKSKELIAKERSYLIEEIEKAGCQVYGSRANYIFFKAKAGLFEHCLKRQILIRDCSNYEGLEEGYYRVAVRTHEENVRLIEALQR